MQSPESFRPVERPKQTLKLNEAALNLPVSLWKDMFHLISTSSDDKPVDKQAPDKPTVVLTKKFNKENAATAIEKLGAPEYRDREKALDLLKNMGPHVLPLLQEALVNHNNPEVRVRAKRCIAIVRNEARREFVDTAKDLLPEYAKLLDQAGLVMLFYLGHDSDTVPLRPSRILPPGIGSERPASPVSKEMQMKFDELIKKLDELSPDDKTFKGCFKNLEDFVLHGAANIDKEIEYLALAHLYGAYLGARRYYATSLSKSNLPEDRSKAVNLLREYLRRDTELKLGDSSYLDAEFLKTFVRCSADLDPATLALFKARGGTEKMLQKGRDWIKKSDK
jgi:hypothetical protein